jgi:hypothetical protein
MTNASNSDEAGAKQRTNTPLFLCAQQIKYALALLPAPAIGNHYVLPQKKLAGK